MSAYSVATAGAFDYQKTSFTPLIKALCSMAVRRNSPIMMRLYLKTSFTSRIIRASPNKMTAANLAIVLSPNLLPVQDNVQSSNSHKVDRKVVESNSQRLKLHTEMLEVMILNSDNVGYVTQIILERRVNHSYK